MIHKLYYQELGLVNTTDMLQRALDEGFAVPAYNFNNMEQLQAIITGCVASKSPVILQVSDNARHYIHPAMLPHLVVGAVTMAEALGHPIPIALHLDHGGSFDLCRDCIESGFSSVMIDGSHLPFQENMALTRRVVEFAHDFDVTVEGELAGPANIENEGQAGESLYTQPEEVEEFVRQTGVDSLAISIGTSHGTYKFNTGTGETPPHLRFDILDEVASRVPWFPIVLHGASSATPDDVTMINQYGGRVDNAEGIPEDQLRRASQTAVCKIDVDGDSRLSMTAAVRKSLVEHPGALDPREYLGPTRDALAEMVKYKNEKVFGSANRV